MLPEKMKSFGRTVYTVRGRADMRRTKMIIRYRDGKYFLSYGAGATEGAALIFLGSPRVLDFFLKAEKRRVSVKPAGIMYGGSEFIFQGKTYPLQTESGSRVCLTLSADKAVFVRPDNISDAEAAAFLKKWLRARLAETVEKRLPVWERVTGLKASRYIITTVKSYWGKMDIATGLMRISDKAAEKPEKAVDYLLVHELTHLKRRNHDKVFYAEIQKYMPDWKEAEKMLKH